MGWISTRHPSRKRLLAWLNAADDSSALTAHVDRCERCATEMEELAAHVGSDGPELTESFGDALREAYSPPDGIDDRVLGEIRRRELAEREMNLLLGLFSIPRDTVELLLPSDPNDELPRERGDEREM